MPSTKTITITYGATAVTLSYVQPTTAYPDQNKNFTEHIIENNSRVRDDAGSPKRRWEFSHDVPLTSGQTTSLDALYLINDVLVLTENFVESSVVYNVHFEYKRPRLETPDGSAHYSLIFQEL